MQVENYGIRPYQIRACIKNLRQGHHRGFPALHQTGLSKLTLT